MKNISKYIAAAAQLGPINPEDSKETVITRMLNLLVEAKTHEANLVVFPEPVSYTHLTLPTNSRV